MNTKTLLSITLAWALVLLPAGGALANDRVRIGGDVVVEKGMTVKDAVAVGGNVTVNGVVNKSAVAVGGSVFLGPDAVVRKDVVCIGGVIEKQKGARIGGDIVEMSIPGLKSVLPYLYEVTPVGWLVVFEIVSFAGLLALALLVVALVPGPIGLISDNVRQNLLKVILCGILGLLVIIPLAIFLMITVIGIPLVALEVLLVGGAMLVGYIAMAQLVGDRLAAAIKRPGLNILWVTVLGLSLLWVIGWVPFLGSAVKSAATLLGFGAVLVTVFSSISRRREARLT
ncbi:MAG: hypothetical protein P8X85_11555 [Desulfobacterales bacterium]